MIELSEKATVKNLLRSGECSILYTKTNGEERTARGTTNLDLVPQDQHPASSEEDYGQQVRYFDLDKAGWRSFVLERMVSISACQ